MKDIYEKLKLFYLGFKEDSKIPVVYENKNLTTHALVIGMTGSGKTGLGIGLIEEATIDNIPSFIIDPKGDMGNLLLSFPDMKAKDFEPWIDTKSAEEKGLSVEQMAQNISKTWREGIQSSGQELNRVEKLRKNSDFTIYTPASSAGVGVKLISTFKAPNEQVLEDSELLNIYVSSIVFSVLNLADIKCDESSKEFVLLSNILLKRFAKKENVSLESLVESIVSPNFKKIGIFALEEFYPKDERVKLAMKLNSIIASPAFRTWMEGEELNIADMLFTKDGKTRVNIFSIAHLNDKQRMFFVSLLLNKIIEWMRSKDGSDRLRMLLYMDEIFGFFPPNQNPPSKQPMMTLLKQARAYGVGVVLCTQNPVDLDYKGLSNIGTWFIGRLQTSQDKERVIDGLEGIKGSKYSKKDIFKLLSNIKKRHFLLKNIHEESLVVFSTRWVLSYLKGPLSKDNIAMLMKDKKNKPKTKKEIKSELKKPVNSLGIKENFFYYSEAKQSILAPFLRLKAEINFVNTGKNVDEKKEYDFILPLDSEELDFETLEPFENMQELKKPRDGSSFGSYSLSDLDSIEKEFKNYIYQNKRLNLFSNKKLKLISSVDESEESFMARVKDALEELKEEKTEKIKKAYEKKHTGLEKKLDSAMLKLDKEKSDMLSKTTSSVISIGASILGAVFGRKLFSATNISKASSSIRQASGVFKERGDVKRVEENIAYLNEQLEALKEELAKDIGELDEEYSLDKYPISTYAIKPRRADIYGVNISLAWIEE